MIIDIFGKEVHIEDWFIRLDQNNEGRLYVVVDYPAQGRVLVHEHSIESDYITPVRRQQNIQLPRTVLWYPQSLLPKVLHEQQS